MISESHEDGFKLNRQDAQFHVLLFSLWHVPLPFIGTGIDFSSFFIRQGSYFDCGFIEENFTQFVNFIIFSGVQNIYTLNSLIDIELTSMLRESRRLTQ